MTVESALLLLFELNNGKKESGVFFNYSEVTLIEFYDCIDNHNYFCLLFIFLTFSDMLMSHRRVR